MNFLFGKAKAPAELLREHQRTLQRAIRDLDRERVKLEQQEKKLIADIKKNAKASQMNACKIQAKDLVRTRRHIQKFHGMRAQLQAVSLRIQTMKSNQSMAEAMRGVTKAMSAMNRQINLPGIQKIMQEFEKQNEMMDMKEEMMNDAIDDAMDEEEDEEEGEAIVNQIFDEIGIQLNQGLANVPTGQAQTNTSNEKVALGEGGATDSDAALQARLRNLRGE